MQRSASAMLVTGSCTPCRQLLRPPPWLQRMRSRSCHIPRRPHRCKHRWSLHCPSPLPGAPGALRHHHPRCPRSRAAQATATPLRGNNLTSAAGHCNVCNKAGRRLTAVHQAMRKAMVAVHPVMAVRLVMAVQAAVQQWAMVVGPQPVAAARPMSSPCLHQWKLQRQLMLATARGLCDQRGYVVMTFGSY